MAFVKKTRATSEVPDYLSRLDQIIRKAFPSDHQVSTDWQTLIDKVSKFGSLSDSELIAGIGSKEELSAGIGGLKMEPALSPRFSKADDFLRYLRESSDSAKAAIQVAIATDPKELKDGMAFCFYDGGELYYSEIMEGVYTMKKQLVAFKSILEMMHRLDIPYAHITTNIDALSNGFTFWVKNWMKNGWRTKAGTDVSNQAEWRGANAQLGLFDGYYVSPPKTRFDEAYIKLMVESLHLPW